MNEVNNDNSSLDNLKIKELVKEIVDYAGTARGNIAKSKYDILKLEEERKRNLYSFINMFLLAIIALVNVVVAILNYYSK